MKKVLKSIVLLCVASLLFACSEDDKPKGKVGICMPSTNLERWNYDGENLQKFLQAENYTVELKYADNDPEKQANQVKDMAESGCDVLILSPVDSKISLTYAKTKKVKVISYDRLIMSSDAVSYYATFDNKKVGELQGEYIKSKLDLDNQEGPFTIELFTGPVSDNNVNDFFGGAMSILSPYITNGKLVVRSGEKTLEAASIADWSTEKAKQRMERIYDSYYAGEVKLDAVLASNDDCSTGVVLALQAKEVSVADFPIITGQDCNINAVKNIINETQSMSIFKDTRKLAQRVVTMVNGILAGDKIETNRVVSNNEIDIPTYVLDPTVVDKENYTEKLIESGYYDASDLK